MKVMEAERKIVVYRYFETSIDANIIKAKLDAFGIPCFLTEENMANLYPGVGYHMLAFRVRLHLFEDDIDSANKILEENHLELDEESVTRCPHCRSKKVERDFTRNIFYSIFMITLGFLGFLPGTHKRVFHCLDCDREFN